MKQYINNIKGLLTCNAPVEYCSEFITYTHSNKEVDDNIPYFERCEARGLSPYKALLYFHDYLNGDYEG